MRHEIEASSEASARSVAAQLLPWECKFRKVGFMRFCLLAAVVAFVGSAILSGGLVLANHVFNIFPASAVSREEPSAAMIFGNLVFAPVVETALMIALLNLFVRVKLSQLISITLSAVIWALLHGTLAPIRFASTIWSFFVFGYVYFLWSSRRPNRGFAAACLTHSYVNVIPTVAMFIEYYALPVNS